MNYIIVSSIIELVDSVNRDSSGHTRKHNKQEKILGFYINFNGDSLSLARFLVSNKRMSGKSQTSGYG